MNKPRVIFGSDHAGFELKAALITYLDTLGYETEDLGTDSAEACDYPDVIFPVAKKVAKTPGLKGVILGGSGQGEAMAANRIRGIRATVYYGGPKDILRLSKEHNNANILSFGARFVTQKEAKSALKQWLETPFSNESRHKIRLEKMDK
ncbi:MAG: RpiB/LacA/LacB family sugar-phosphate isomerase [Nanoarchaeota archaeon]|nr:RpiB/LacA/LacB family sugar-phosphate isomerase [Nanoarchaeota archaeon]